MRWSLNNVRQFWTAAVLFVNSGYSCPMSELHEMREPGPPRFPLWLRIALFALGWLLILVGIAGLVLPGIQGVLTLLVGIAVLSLVSELAYELLRKGLRRWPAAWTRVESFREKTHRKLRRFHRDEGTRDD
jgi:hypothetical protein